MLYEAEEVVKKYYDPMTGEEVELQGSLTMEEQVQKEYEEQLISNSNFLKRMKRDDGWKIVSRFLEMQANEYREALVGLQDFDKIRRLQEAIKCYRSVLNYVDAMISEGEALREEQTKTRD